MRQAYKTKITRNSSKMAGRFCIVFQMNKMKISNFQECWTNFLAQYILKKADPNVTSFISLYNVAHESSQSETNHWDFMVYL